MIAFEGCRSLEDGAKSPMVGSSSSLFTNLLLGLAAVKRSSMRNALVSGPGRGNFPREILIETIAETGVKQSIVEQSSEIR